MSSVNIPDDVMMEILAHLPVKCLIKFKCVCKRWSALLENRSFIAKHHQTQVALNNNGCILIKRGRLTFDYDIFSLLCSKESTVNCVDLVVPFIKETTSLTYVQLIGPCNGLVCAIDVRKFHITIWNPATREFKSLPRFFVPKPEELPNACQWESIGFGFDCKTNDYKVIRIWNVFLGNGKDYAARVEVLNLSNNCWRQIDAAPLVLLSQEMTDYVYRNGKFYWRGACNNLDTIVSFDMVDEVFKGIELPDYRCVGVVKGYWWAVRELNGSIALISNPLGINDKCFEIWMMNEFGDHISWSKYMIVEAPIEVWDILYGLWKNGEILLDDGYERLVSYDPCSKEVKHLGVYPCPLQQVMIYNESLVSVK